MESKASEGNELGAIQYVSEITGANVKTVANWFIFLLIFVFDPLAITLIIATNRAFEDIKPKKNIYGEIKSIEPESQIEPQLEPKPTPQPNPAIEQERQKILHQIQRVEKSGAAHAARGVALTELHNKLSSLSDDNTKTY
jgi:hypothetical protein